MPAVVVALPALGDQPAEQARGRGPGELGLQRLQALLLGFGRGRRRLVRGLQVRDLLLALLAQLPGRRGELVGGALDRVEPLARPRRLALHPRGAAGDECRDTRDALDHLGREQADEPGDDRPGRERTQQREQPPVLVRCAHERRQHLRAARQRRVRLHDRPVELGVGLAPGGWDHRARGGEDVVAEAVGRLGLQRIGGELLEIALQLVAPLLHPFERALGVGPRGLRGQRLLADLRQHRVGALLDDVVVLVVGDAQVVEDVRDQARPQVALGVVPGVELDLHDPLVPGDVALQLAAVARIGGQLADPPFEAPHEERLARPPVAEQPHGQRWIDGPRRQQRGERVDVRIDLESLAQILGRPGVIGAVGGEAPPRRWLQPARPGREGAVPRPGDELIPLGRPCQRGDRRRMPQDRHQRPRLGVVHMHRAVPAAAARRAPS